MAIWDRFLKPKIDEEVSRQVLEVEKRMVEVSEQKSMEKAKEIHQVWLDDLEKANRSTEAVEGKSLLYDPFQLLDTMKYKERPMMLTYDVLRAMSERNPIVASIINTRVNQIAAFSAPPKSPYDIGFRIHLRDDKLEPSKSDEARIKELTFMVEETAISQVPGEERDSLDSFLRKITRDTLTYDQMAFEIINGKGGFPVAFLGIDASTIRLASTARFFKDIRGGLMQPPRVDLAMGTRQKEEIKPEDIRYVQVLDGKVVTTYTCQELGFGIRNPRSSIKQNGYGVSELEILVNTVTAHLWAEEYNRRFFSQGSAPKGIIHFEGNISQEQLNAFRRQWHAQVMGVFNAWRTPIVAAPAKLQYTNLQMSNKQMEFANWIDYLIKICCAVYLIDPSEIGFELRGGAQPGQTPAFESHQESRQKMSKDRGLRPLMKFIQHEINRNIIYRIDDGKYEFEFIGLDTKTEEQLQEMRIKEVTNFKTIDEVRAEYDLEPLGHDRGGDVINSPSYLSYLNQLAMAKQATEGGGMGGGGFGGEEGEEGGEEEGGIPGEEEGEGEGRLDFGEEEGGGGEEGKDFGEE